MAREALTYEDVGNQTGLDARTLRGILYGAKRPHAKTLKRLAEGLGVSVDELFAGDEAAALGDFDAATNPAIRETVEAKPELFEEWTPKDFGELASRVGSGGPLTPEGVIESAQRMNVNRQTLGRTRFILESDQAEALRVVIDAMYDRVNLSE